MGNKSYPGIEINTIKNVTKLFVDVEGKIITLTLRHNESLKDIGGELHVIREGSKIIMTVDFLAKFKKEINEKVPQITLKNIRRVLNDHYINNY
ncbi:hypothetical protein E2R51_02440 [Jeotgalibacillus sp. S-D1]|uniref:hypothetical protein n=1 Tax=Jeotgalibacillus sp. S-D1 TaxID=2552189 RepID=UPI001059A3CA|nr:hypothetical protein [Jeotgalibacillus sp. S-D1]TDL34596.1 hypothetical protein E2R51_02440 [Jeotgalibacillus sp. S-D1]